MGTIYTAIITPFNEDMSLDVNAFRALLVLQEQAGISGVVIGGTTGEGWSLSSEEFEVLYKIARDTFSGKVIIGTGAISTKETVKKTQEAKKMGADAVLVVVPCYNLPSERGVIAHYLEVSKVGIDVIAYHHPHRTGVTLSLPCLIEIARLPGIIGVKETSGDEKIIRELSKYTTVYSGNDGELKWAKKLGATKAISVVSNIFPKEAIDFFATDESDLEGYLHQFIQELFKEGNPIGIKAALAKKNYCKNIFRLPLQPLTDKGRANLYELIESSFNKEIANK